ncbi:hypothetical protein EAS64_30360 [Trebonia kvetii]|uniref:Uncharacterized protein n=1 Tax=Trebonia kvetii TaxID=2480626 RepID=A0A6P2BRT8_9ACTN|nr:hypothetical protein EAS64_30360 [Trebonia kvetii]
MVSGIPGTQGSPGLTTVTVRQPRQAPARRRNPPQRAGSALIRRPRQGGRQRTSRSPTPRLCTNRAHGCSDDVAAHGEHMARRSTRDAGVVPAYSGDPADLAPEERAWSASCSTIRRPTRAACTRLRARASPPEVPHEAKHAQRWLRLCNNWGTGAQMVQARPVRRYRWWSLPSILTASATRAAASSGVAAYPANARCSPAARR